MFCFCFKQEQIAQGLGEPDTNQKALPLSFYKSLLSAQPWDIYWAADEATFFLFSRRPCVVVKSERNHEHSSTALRG